MLEIVAGYNVFLVYDSDVSMLRVSGNSFPRIDNISIPGNMFLRTSKGRQICDVMQREVKVLFLLMPIHVVTCAAAATKVLVSWSGEISSAEESIKEW